MICTRPSPNFTPSPPRRSSSTWALLWALLLAAPLSAQENATQAQNKVSPETFLSLTTYPEVALSRDGKRLAFVTSRDDFELGLTMQTVWWVEVRDIPKADEGKGVPKALPMTFASGKYSRLRWSPNGKRLAFLVTRGRDKAPKLVVQNLRGNEPSLVGQAPRGVWAFDWTPDGKGLIFATPNEDMATEGRPKDSPFVRFPGPPEAFDLFFRRMDGPSRPRRIATVPLTVIALAVSPNGKTIALLDGPSFDPRLFTDSQRDYEIFLLDWWKKPPLRQLTDNHLVELDLAWAPDGRSLLSQVVGEIGARRDVFTQQHPVRIDLEDGHAEGLADGFDGHSKELVVAGGDRERLWMVGNLSTRTTVYRLLGGASASPSMDLGPGAISKLAVSAQGRVAAFVSSPPDSFPEIFAAIAAPGEALQPVRPVTNLNQDHLAEPLPELETLRWQNREGQNIEGILTWPPGRKGEQGLPTVVDLHGGPWSARNEELAFNGNYNFASFPTLLALRGFLVLAPNYRGSSGRGQEFLQSIAGHSCSRPVEDVLAGVDFLVEAGWADPQRLGVMGYSFGGTLTNCILGLDDRFRAAAAGAGIWNDASYFGTADNFLQTDMRFGGRAPWEAPELFWRESAISRADRIRTPLHLVHGDADQRVPATQSLELYRALRRRGIEVEMLLFPGEKHLFENPIHKAAKVAAELRWLEERLTPNEAPPEEPAETPTEPP